MDDFDSDGQQSGGNSTATVLILSSCSLVMIIVIYFMWKMMNNKPSVTQAPKTQVPNTTLPTTTNNGTTTKSGTTTKLGTTGIPIKQVPIGNRCKQTSECSGGVCCGVAGSPGVCLETCEGSRSGICEFKYTGNSQCDKSAAKGKTKKPDANLKTCKKAKDCPNNVCCGLPGKSGYCMNSCEGTGLCRFSYNGNSTCKI